MILLLASLAGCVQGSEPDLAKPLGPPRAKAPPGKVKAWMASSPCGVLSVRRPLVNVSGHMTALGAGDRQLFLYLAPNRSYDAVLWTVEHCRYLARTQVADDGEFQFNNLPAGNYSVLYRRSANDGVQGFPVIDESNASAHTVEMLWHGGDQGHSLAVFAIQARLE